MQTAFDSIKAEQQLKEDTLQFLQRRIRRRKGAVIRRMALAAAAVLLAAFTGLLTYRMYFTQAAYLDVDVNPGIELQLNSFNRVIGVHAYNADGDAVLAALELQNKTCENAVVLLIDRMIALGYLDDAALFTATLQAENGKDERVQLEALRAYIDAALRANGTRAQREVFAVDAETKTCANEENLSPAKYLAIVELQQVDPAATFDNCRSSSISEIKEKCHGSGNGHGSSGSNSSSGNHHTESQSTKATQGHSSKNKNHGSRQSSKAAQGHGRGHGH